MPDKQLYPTLGTCPCHGHPDGPCDECIGIEVGIAAERATVVTYLRRLAANDQTGLGEGYAELADRIERGEHE